MSANTALDGTGYVSTVFTAGANGSYLQRLLIRAVGSNAATVLRVFLNNGSTNATQANNCLIAEVTLPLTSASTTSALAPAEVPLNFAIPAGFKINVTLGAAVSAGYRVCCIAGDY